MSAFTGIPVPRSGVVYYIDASYFIFRAYHSMPPDMVDADGNATHALYGFARFISDLLEQVRPERIGVALSEEFQLEPEQSTDALITFHPEARYFNV